MIDQLLPRRGRMACLAGLIAVVVILAGCSLAGPGATITGLPAPSCGGVKVAIEGALPCRRIAEIAIATLRERMPDELARGVVAIDVQLQGCPTDLLPQQLDCTGEPFVQLVTVTFGPPGPGGLIEPSMSVGVDPVSGRVLGIVNPLVR